MKYQIGDIITIKNGGYEYTTYEIMATALKLSNQQYSKQNAIKGKQGKIVSMEKHFTDGNTIYGIRMTESGYDVMMSEPGIEFVKRPVFLPEDLFTL